MTSNQCSQINLTPPAYAQKIRLAAGSSLFSNEASFEAFRKAFTGPRHPEQKDATE